MTRCFLVFLTAIAGGSSSAVAATVKPAGLEASSYLVSNTGESYEVKYLSDGKQETAWIEGEEGSGLGSWIKIELGASKRVAGLQVWNGYWITHDFWQRHNRAKEIEVELSDGTKHTFELKDEMLPETVRFPAPVDTASINLRIKSVHRGNTFNDTGFSEIRVLDTSPPVHYSPSQYQSSSTLPTDGDGNYETKNLHDGMADSMWCEGNEAGDGKGEWLEFDFGRELAVSKLRMRNGSAGSFSAFMATNRAKSATLQFSDGSTATVVIKPSLIEQTVLFTRKQTTKVKMTFTDVVKGNKYNDLCVSEAVFLP